MNYPLGSFPRFAHQERRAQERRARAIISSAITRRNHAAYYLEVEIAFFNWLIELVNPITSNTEKGARILAAIKKQLLNIKTKLESGKRVYFKCLGRILHSIAVNGNVFPNLHHLDNAALAEVAENIGKEELLKQYKQQ